ncbi:MAG TPA: hypothetical protein VKR30_08270 [Candidatus Limnocylindrales bacterium]|nr:hypothetical protein [Candidatus Limnocylindrales bacterium]
MTSGEAPGLKDQIGRTIAAGKRLFRAHVDLAKAEAGEIAGEVGRMIALFALAFGFLFALLMLLLVGLPLFLAEWLLGSIGWGVLLGVFLLIDLAVIAALVALGVSTGRLVLALVVGIVLGVALAVGLATATDWPHTIDAALGIWLGLIVWLVGLGVAVARGGIDGEALKQRFTPDQTIELTKETIEWVRARTPLVPKS